MRLVLATPLYPPEIGGPATDAAALARELEARGMAVVVCPFSRVRRLPKLLRHLGYALVVARASRGADAIVAFDTVSAGLPALLAARATRTPLVVRVPGDYAWEQGVQRFGVADPIDAFQQRRYGLRVGALRLAQRRVVRGAALVIAPSDYFTGIVAGWGVSAARLKRIYLGLPPLPPAREPADRPAGRLLVSIGRFVPWKGFGLLIDLLPDLPGWQLALVGDGPLAPALKAQAAARGVSERVRFTGALSRAEALGWLACADAFALNTAFESFSFQVLEAMLAGAPVIATTVGSLPELIDNGVEGVLLAPSDRAGFLEAIRSVERDPETWAARRAAARRASADFSLGASAGAFAEAIMTVCA